MTMRGTSITGVPPKQVRSSSATPPRGNELGAGPRDETTRAVRRGAGGGGRAERTPAAYADREYAPSEYADREYAPSEYADREYAPSDYADRGNGRPGRGGAGSRERRAERRSASYPPADDFVDDEEFGDDAGYAHPADRETDYSGRGRSERGRAVPGRAEPGRSVPGRSERRSARYADEEYDADEEYVEEEFGYPDDIPTSSVRRVEPYPPVRDERPVEDLRPAAEPRQRPAGRLTRPPARRPSVVDPQAALDLRNHRMRVRMLKLLWTTTFLLLVFVPLALAPGAGGELRPWSEGGIWVELCLTTGLLGLSTLAATIVLPSRVKSITQAFGIEGVLRSHRWLALATTVVVVAHVVFIVIDKPLNVLLLSPGPTGANRARAGLVATVAMILLCVLSFRRKKMGTRYDVWRWVHAMLAVAALAGTYMHMYWLNHLMQDAAERTAFLSILVGVSAIMINRWIRRPFASVRQAYLVKAVYQETPTVSTLVLTPAGRHQRPMQYRPGQFAWIRLDSPFGPLQSNPFSLASGIDSPRDLEFTIRNAGDFTSQVGQLTPGRKVFVDGPYGDFNDDSKGSQSLLLIGAGVGMSPMMSIIRSHAFRGDRRPHVLVSAQKTPDELMFTDELRQLQQEMNLEVIEVVSKPPSSWTGVTGRVDEELLGEILEAYELHAGSVFICGPPQMMEAAKEALVQLGIPARDVHTEQFDMV